MGLQMGLQTVNSAVKRVINRVIVAFFMAMLLVLFFNQTALAGNLATLPSIAVEEGTPDHPECETIKTSFEVFSRKMSAINDKLINYLSQASVQYHLWHMELMSYENTHAVWPTEYFLPLINSGASIETSKDHIYLWSSDNEDFLHLLEAQIQDKNCFTSSVQREELLDGLAQFITNHSEHFSAVGDFLSRMQVRLVTQVIGWQKLEGAGGSPIQTGYFLFLKSESDVFLEAAGYTQSNAAYLGSKFSDIQSRVDKLLLPLAPNP